MALEISACSAIWFLPFVAPICFYVAWSDMQSMTIPNRAVLALAGLFLVLGLFALPLAEYPGRLLQLAIVLVVGIVLNAAGVVGAGDAKFTAAAAPFVAAGDALFVCIVFSAMLLAAWTTHRVAKFTPIRRAVPHWKSWDQGRDFPMGLPLAGTLSLYLALGILYGA